MKKLLSILAFVATAAVLPAQSSFKDDFEAFKRQAKQDYDDFRKRANAEYTEFLRKAWEEFAAFGGDTLPREKELPPVVYVPPTPEVKPDTTPVVQPDTTPVVQPKDTIVERLPQEEIDPIHGGKGGLTTVKVPVVIPPITLPDTEPKRLPYEDILTIPNPTPQPQPISPIKEIPAPPQVEIPTMTVQLYGTGLKLRKPSGKLMRLKSVKENAIADAWAELSGDEYNNMLFDLLQIRKGMQLCDWAYLELLEKAAEAVYGKATNEAILLKAYLYSQSGYKMRLASNDSGRLFMLVASKYIIFGQNYFVLDGERYYQIGTKENSLNISSAQMKNEKALSLRINKEQLLKDNLAEERTLTSRFGITATCQVNQNIVDFYNKYPSAAFGDDFGTRWALLANTPLDANIKKSLYPQLQEQIKDLEVEDKVNVLLNFVQTAFVYEYDDVVWGEDRAFFAAETLYYPYCDCEDRSILFTRLVRDLVGLDAVLIYYPGHLASAVSIPNFMKGDYLQVDGKRYTICDPTYINAPVGKTMPGMDNATAKVIVL